MENPQLRQGGAAQLPLTTSEVLFLDDGESTPRSLEMTAALTIAVLRADQANARQDRFAISFTSLFIGLISGDDPVGDWLRTQFASAQVDLQALLRRRGMDSAGFQRLRESHPRWEPNARPLLRTASARAALNEGQRLARDLQAPLDTRHVVAAYISLPAYHDEDFRGLRIDRQEWAAAFSRGMAQRYPLEAQFWESFSGRVFLPPAPPPPPPPPTPPTDGELDLSPDKLEPHVGDALAHAGRLAAGAQVGPQHVIRAVVGLAASAGSKAFKRFAEISRLPANPVSGLSGSPRLEPRELTEDLRRQLSYAQRPGAGSTGPRRLWGRDLITAALLCPDPDLAGMLAQARRPIDVVRDQWHAFVTADPSDRSEAEWNDWWLSAGEPRPGRRRAGHATETDEGEDQLGIDVEARAFAQLILDKDVKAPLSIGLLGDWGSGKSFFIEEIKKQIRKLHSEQHRDTPDRLLAPRSESYLHEHVVQIEFNAWHASDANLWASLVTYIFDEIWKQVSLDATPESKEAAKRELIESIDKAKGAVHEAEAQVESARQALATAEADLKGKKEKLAWDRFPLETVSRLTKEKLTELAKNAGWHGAIDTINDVEDAARSLTVAGQRLRQVVAALIERPLMYIALPAVLLAGVTAAAWYISGQIQAQSSWMVSLSKWLATAVSAIGALVAPLRAASGKVNGLAKKLEEIRKGYDAAVAQKPTEQARELANARRELASAEASVTAAQGRLAELMNQRATMDPARRLGAFLQERVQSTQYRSQQGIISMVHKDFRQLSDYMKALRDGTATSESPDGARIKPFDRIVLYVDDLDRCRPDQVVHMLEAVHLLLALDLFVVVVAVDSRWLIRALEVHYKELLHADTGRADDGLRASTPQSYLEKIFQVTYALGPMNAGSFKSYVASLAGLDKRPARTIAVAPASAAHAPGAQPPATIHLGSGAKTEVAFAPPQSAAAAPPPTGGAGPTNGHSGKRSDATPPARIVMPPPHEVRIDEEEQAMIVRLLPLLPTPRIAKRLVNVYRLIKASKDVKGLEEFQAAKRAESCLLMLAILFGRPADAAGLCRALQESRAPFDKPDVLLRDALQRLVSSPSAGAVAGQANGDWHSLGQLLVRLDVKATVADCAREPMEIARYSLVTGQEWHTWPRPAPPSAA